jgi:WXG100 family type VII secretion target
MSELQVTPEAITHAATELRTIAEELRAGMASLDDEVNTVVGGSWSGAASSAFGSVWREWHEGAAHIVEGLTMMSGLLDEAAPKYIGSDGAGASAIDSTGL